MEIQAQRTVLQCQGSRQMEQTPTEKPREAQTIDAFKNMYDEWTEKGRN